MDFNEYQEAAVRTWGRQMPKGLAERLHEEGATEATINMVREMGERLDWSILGLGLSGEAGEVSDEIKKFAGHGHWKEGFDLKKELGDVLWYVAVLCELGDLSLEDVAVANEAKLRKRYADGFSTEASKARIDVL